MKKVSIILAISLLVIFLSSCLKTLYPIFTEKDIVYNPDLLGRWQPEKKEGTDQSNLIITSLADEKSLELPGNISSIKQKGYFISYESPGGSVKEQYIAFLARIGKHLYFDYYPLEKQEKKVDEFFLAHFVKVHTSYRVDISGDGSFELSQLDEGHLTKLINEKKFRIKHEKDENGDIMIITAPTEELQQYLIKYGDDPEAYRSDKTKFSKINL